MQGVYKQLNKTKSRGFEAGKLFNLILILPYWGISNIRGLFNGGLADQMEAKKDAFYEFLKNDKICWRSILDSFTRQFNKAIAENSEPSDAPQCLIVDDTFVSKTGKTMEFIGKVFDHALRINTLGYKILTLCLSDGKTLLPVDLSIHSEARKDGRRGLKLKDLAAQFSKKRAVDSKNKARIEEVFNDKISTAISMIKKALKLNISPKYVLADSWFICEKFLRELSQKSLTNRRPIDVVGMMKTNFKIEIEGKALAANNVPNVYTSNIKYCRKLKGHYIKKKATIKGMEIMAYWVKPRGQETWKLLISNDLKLSFNKVMELYSMRWSIEVFFKDCKQNLGLEKCQSTDFNAQLASITLCFINYGILAVKKRINTYETIGGMFREIRNQTFEKNLVEKIWQLFQRVFNLILFDLFDDWELFIQKLIIYQDNLQTMILEISQLFKPEPT